MFVKFFNVDSVKHFVHWCFCLPHGQRLPPPHLAHLLFSLPHGQSALPPHFLQCDFRLPHGQNALPPHLTHKYRLFPHGHRPLPPHLAHLDFRLPHGHVTAPCVIAITISPSRLRYLVPTTRSLTARGKSPPNGAVSMSYLGRFLLRPPAPAADIARRHVPHPA